MKEVLKAVSNTLRADATLKSLVGYTSKKKNIRRGYSMTGEWKKLLVFYLQTETVKTDFTNVIRDVPLILRAYDRDSDLNCDDIVERAITVLDGANLTIAGQVFCYNCSYFGGLVSTSWNEEVQSFERVVRFMLVVRKES